MKVVVGLPNGKEIFEGEDLHWGHGSSITMNGRLIHEPDAPLVIQDGMTSLAEFAPGCWTFVRLVEAPKAQLFKTHASIALGTTTKWDELKVSETE